MKRPESITRSTATRSSSRRPSSGVEVSKSGTAIAAQRSGAAEQLQVGAGHQPDQLLEARLWLPSEVPRRLGGVSDQVVHLRRSHERGVDLHVALEVPEPDLLEGHL